jgi:hypothetical protein
MLLDLNGAQCFGYALECRMTLNPSARQISSFFGISGVQSIFGGARGRVFMVRGLWYGSSIYAAWSQEANMETFGDGVARQLNVTTSDGSTASWANIVYGNEYSRDGPPLWNPTIGVWVQPYRLTLHGLT